MVTREPGEWNERDSGEANILRRFTRFFERNGRE